MTYVLCKLSKEDKEKLLGDLRNDPRKQKLLTNRRYLDDDNELTWAIDRGRDMYLMSAPSPLPEPRINGYYFFHHDDKVITIKICGLLGQVISFEDKIEMPSDVLMDDLKSEIKSAFAVYGRCGEGPKGGLKFSSEFS